MTNDHPLPGTTLDSILDQVEAVVRHVLKEADVATNKAAIDHLLHPLNGNRGTEAFEAAIIYRDIGRIRKAVAANKSKMAAFSASIMMYRFMRARFQFTWKPELDLFRVASDRRKIGAVKANVGKKHAADEFWKPWEERYDELREEGIGPYKARAIVAAEMRVAGCLRSESGIKRRLTEKASNKRRRD